MAQKSRRETGSTPVVGSSRITRSGSWISVHQAQLLLHAARQLAHRAVAEAVQAGHLQQLALALGSSAAGTRRRRPKKSTFSSMDRSG
jgi:hypothetical protein